MAEEQALTVPFFGSPENAFEPRLENSVLGSVIPGLDPDPPARKHALPLLFAPSPTKRVSSKRPLPSSSSSPLPPSPSPDYGSTDSHGGRLLEKNIDSGSRKVFENVVGGVLGEQSKRLPSAAIAAAAAAATAAQAVSPPLVGGGGGVRGGIGIRDGGGDGGRGPLRVPSRKRRACVEHGLRVLVRGTSRSVCYASAYVLTS